MEEQPGVYQRWVGFLFRFGFLVVLYYLIQQVYVSQ